MTARQPMHLVFCVDDNFCLPLGVLIESIIQTTSRTCHLHILGHAISDDNLARLRLAGSQCAGMRFYDVDHAKVNDIPISKAFSERWSVATYYRFLIPELLADDISRVLYLDADMLVTNDIAGLYGLDLGDSIAAVVADATLDKTDHWQEISLAEPGYFNAGMMLMDLDKWREEDISKQCFSLLESGREWPYNDQDILNVILEDNVKYLENTWNKQSADAYIDPTGNIIHFTGAEKPWHVSCVHPFKHHYQNMLSESVYQDKPLQYFLDMFDRDVVNKLSQEQSGVASIWIYGAGLRGRRLYHYIRAHFPVLSVNGFIDKTISGDIDDLPVLNNASLASSGHILIGSAAFYDEILDTLKQAGISRSRII